MLHGTTALLVVHRPSTIALADRVDLLSDGTISAIGTHSELLATVPSYQAVLSASMDEQAPTSGQQPTDAGAGGDKEVAA